MNDFRNNVKKVMVVFLIFFVALISYIAYFQVFKAPEIASRSGNKRLWAKRNEVVRGTIYDRNKTALTKGEKTGDLTQSREYIYGDLYSHALGFCSQKYGLTGLENAYDTELSTYSGVQTGLKTFLKDFDFDALKKAFDTRGQEEKKIGNGIVTTLDPAIQKAAYDALGNRKGAAVALNPKTGEVLAMVSKPTFNPNNLDEANSTTEGSPLLNRVTDGKYPPGSTFNTVTTTSALQNIEGVTRKIFNDNGKIVFEDGNTLPNVGGVANGSINLKTAFQLSSNVVFGTLAMDLGNDKLKETAEKFGFNNSIPAEGFTIAKSSFPTLQKYEKGMIAQTGIGQSSILATPIQMALVASTIANDGVMMQPKLVNEIVDMDGNTIKKVSSKKYNEVMTKAQADTVTDYMVNLVNSNSGMSYFNGLNVAGKTGTAENSSGQDHSWFIGFAPANDPQIAVAVIVENGGFGAKAAAPVVGDMMNAAFNR